MRLSDDVLSLNPSHVALMFGMNDLGGYFERTKFSKNMLDSKNSADLLNFNSTLGELVLQLLAKNICTLLQSITVYDSTMVSETPNAVRKPTVLKDGNQIIQNMSHKYHLLMIDYWNILSDINTNIQILNPNKSIIGPDRVHPGTLGNFVMTYAFLNATEKHSLISHMVLLKDVDASQRASNNCLVHSLIRNISSNNSLVALEAVITELALPFVIADDQRKALALVPFVKDFNMEVLKVRGLDQNPPGGREIEYKLSIDGIKIGVFSSNALANGINLSGNKRTPQHIQATQVHEILLKLWQVEHIERFIKFVENNYMMPFFVSRSKLATELNFTEAGKYLVDYVAHSHRPRLNQTFSHYLVLKRDEANLPGEMQLLRTQARALAAPKPHKFSLVLSCKYDHEDDRLIL